MPDFASADEDPSSTLLGMMRGYWVSQTIFVAARLGIADLLADGPRPCASLAESTGLPERSVYRLLRALASVGVFTEVGEREFGLTPLADSLRTDAAGSQRGSGIVMGELFYRAWDELLPSLRTESSQFDQTFGTDLFSCLGANPELGSRFQDMMAGVNASANASVSSSYDFSEMSRVVDVGGGNGSLLAAVLGANPGLHGALLELPEVLDEARPQLAAAGVADRCDLVGGDLLAATPTDPAVPAGYDAYLLRWVLHDFDDDRAVHILEQCRAGMPAQGRLLVVEQVLTADEDPASWVSKFMDLHMLVLFGGQERTESEFRELFRAAGFELRRVIPTGPALSILEAVPS